MGKMEEFESFLSHDLNFQMGRESHLAIYYFADLVQRLLPVQRTSKFATAKSHLLATAWDMWLLRLPELLLNPYEHPLMNLAYICSAEQELEQLGRFFGIEWMGVRSDNHTIIGPVLSLDLPVLESRLGRDQVRAIMSQRRLTPFQYRGASMPAQCISERIDTLATKLESELLEFLQG